MSPARWLLGEVCVMALCWYSSTITIIKVQVSYEESDFSELVAPCNHEVLSGLWCALLSIFMNGRQTSILRKIRVDAGWKIRYA